MNALTPSEAIQPARSNTAILSDGAPMPTVNVDFRRIFAAVYRNRFFIAAILLAAFVLGLAVTLSTVPTYQARATVQIDTQAQSVLKEDAEQAAGQDVYDVDRYIKTYLDVLKSRAMAGRVANALNLAANDTFFNRMGMAAPEAPTIGQTMAETRRNAVIDILQASIYAEVPRDSKVVEIFFTSTDPDYAAQIVNSYADNFIDANLQRRFESSAYARKYLEEQLALAKQRLETSERAQIDYARETGLIDIETGTSKDGESSSTSLLVNNLVQANNSLNTARDERIRAEQRYRTAAGSALLSIPEVQSNSVIQNLLNDRADATAEKARDGKRYLPDHPVMLQHAERVRTIDQQLSSVATQIRDSLRQQFNSAQRAEQEIQGQVSELRSGNQSEQAQRVQYNILAREAATNRTMYDGLLQRYKEVSASAGVSTNNISLIDKALVPDGPIRPRPLVNMGVALLAGLGLAGLFVLLRDFFDDATRTPDDVVNKLQVPFLGVLPRMPEGMSASEVIADPKSSMSEAFAALRTSISLLSSEGSLRTLMVTSSRESEGKSMVAYGIGRSFARLGLRVIVIDSDLRRPSQHRLWGLEREKGLTNVLSRQLKWQDVVQKTNDPKVDFIASGPLPPSVPELISGGNFEGLLAELEGTYDLVVVDAPPVLGLADVILLGHMIRHLVYVIESGRPLRGRGLAAIRRLRAANIKIDGAVLNKFDPKNSGYGYEYGYYYYYGKEK